jgi:hypothetical protein
LQVKEEEKSSEITAISGLLKVLAIRGCIVTIDAMGWQREIAAEITGKEAYILAVKGNQGTLEGNAEETVTSSTASGSASDNLSGTCITSSALVPSTMAVIAPLRPLAALPVRMVRRSPLDSEVLSILKCVPVFGCNSKCRTPQAAV